MTFDLDALIAEQTGSPFEFTFGGDTYQLPPHIDIRAVAAMSAGRLDDALRMLLGADQWTRMQAVDAVFDERAMAGLFEAYMAFVGTSPGESAASTSS